MLKKIFITGLAAIIPIGITIYVIFGLFSFADNILGKFINQVLQKYLGYKIPGIGILLSILIILTVGFILHISRMRFYRAIEDLFLKIPLIKKIYLPVKQIVNFVFFPKDKKFVAVVLVEYPRKGVYTLGFITSKNSKLSDKINQREIYSVFIPSTPSPLTGFTIFLPKDELIFVDISVEDAIKLVISGGLLTPYESEIVTSQENKSL